MNRKYQNIIFNESRFDAIICLDANLPSKKIFERFENIPILAADGAAIKLIKKGLDISYIIGDLDTISNSKFQIAIPSDRIIYLPEQEHNDFEKTLDFAQKKKYKNILIFGFHGGLLEHTLNNWSVLAKFSQKLNLCLYDKARYALPLRHSFRIKVNYGEIISIIPMTRVILKTKNLQWELNNEELKIGTREGARNIAISEDIYIDVIEGEILFFIDERVPLAPEYHKK